MKKIVFIFLILFACSIFAQTWETQNSGVKCTLRSICFIDSLNGWIVGDSSTILKTNDGGKNWSKQSSPIKFTSLTKIQFVSKAVGFIVGTGGLFMSTSDGGINWAVNYIMPDSSGFSYGDFCFVNENEGWVPGRKEGRNYGIGLIMHTTNGGKTWEKQLETFTNIQTQAKYFSSIKFIDNKIGWALASDYFDAGSATLIYKTENSGQKWDNVGRIETYPEIKLEVISKDSLWVGGTLLATSFDGGLHWSYISDNLNQAQLISPVSGLEGWIYYSYFYTQEKRILFTKDAGKTWREELKWNGPSIAGMTNRNGYLWIVGTDGYIKKRNSIFTSIKEEGSELPNEFKLYPNYPNPFNPTTKISFTIPEKGNVKLRVFDVLGREVAILPDGVYEAGNFPSGVYFCNLVSGSNSITKKMLLVK